MPNSDERLLAVFSHLLPIFGLGFVGPLIIYLIKKNDPGFVTEHAKNALNFQISVFIYGIISAILCIVLIGFLLLIAIPIFSLVCVIIGAVSASNGDKYEYPFCIVFIK